MDAFSPDVSVIIPTYNGAHKIHNVLGALAVQTFTNFEVIVVIDGSTDNTDEIVKNFLPDFKQLEIISQANKGRAGARNTGAEAAVGKILVFYDDDMRPTKNSLSQHVGFHAAHANAICVGYPLEEEPLMKSDIQKYKAYLSRKWLLNYDKGATRLNNSSLFVTAANLSIPKSLFDKIGGFEERLSDAEDFEFGVRALRKNFPVYFNKDNIAWHDDLITCRGYIKRQREYSMASKTLSQFVPPSFLRKELNPHNMFWGKRWVFSFFAHRFWVNLIDKEKLQFLPKPIRYKIYDWVITGLGKVFTDRNIIK